MRRPPPPLARHETIAYASADSRLCREEPRLFTFNTAPRIVFGPGCLAGIGQRLAAGGATRPFIVTDAGLVTLGLVEPLLVALGAAGLVASVYSGVQADPPEATVLEATAAARAAGADIVLGFGGGSSLDVAKLVALLAATPTPLRDIYGVDRARGRRLPLTLVPTTAGTGSEVTPIAIVTTGQSEKMGVVSPLLLPDLALLDPELTYGLPAAITAATGIDAMVHAIEAFTSISPNANPVSRALAREALRLLGGAILPTVLHQDRAGRADMLLGSLLAGQAFANSPVAAVHALAYPIGGHLGVPHGLSNALVLPHVLRFNAPAASGAYAELAAIVFPHRAGAEAENFADALAELAAACGLPSRLRDVGARRDQLDLLAGHAMKQQRLLVNNPRPLTLADARAIYEAAY